MIAMKPTILAATMFLGSLFPAWADTAAHTDWRRGSGTLYIDSKACLKTRAMQTSGFFDSPNATQCSRSRARRHATRAIPGDEFVCIADVLHSEELAGAPIFYHLVRATLRITPPGMPAFETTVEKMIAWQVPPPRQGQRLRQRCDPASSSTWHFTN
jgi:hypothetical protein